MKYTEEKGDLFDLPTHFVLAHCIDSSAIMGAGIAKEFAARYPEMHKMLKQNFNPIGSALVFAYDTSNLHHVGNLITKFHVSQNRHSYTGLWPNLDSIRTALWSLRLRMEYQSILSMNLGLPLIGCGLDGLHWPDVREVVQEVFDDSDRPSNTAEFNIVVRYLKEEDLA